MAIFDDILREEENLGGFIPGEPDDDSFLLESQGDYPDDIPEFVDDPPPPPSEPKELEVSDDGISFAEQIDVPEDGGSVWDAFDDPVSDQETDEVAFADEDDDTPVVEETGEVAFVDEDDIDNIFENDSNEESAPFEDSVMDTDEEFIGGGQGNMEEQAKELAALDDILEEQDELPAADGFVTEEEEIADSFAEEVPDLDNAFDNVEDVAPDPVPEPVAEKIIDDVIPKVPAAPVAEESVDIDDELRQMLQNDLNKSKSRQEDMSVDELIGGAAVQEEKFVPVEDQVDTEYIELTDLDQDEQSEPKQESKADDANADKDTKKKKGGLWTNVVIGAAAMLAIATMGLGSYYFLFHESDDINVDVALVQDSSKVKQIVPKDTIKKDEPKKQAISPKLDTAEIVKKDTVPQKPIEKQEIKEELKQEKIDVAEVIPEEIKEEIKPKKIEKKSKPVTSKRVKRINTKKTRKQVRKAVAPKVVRQSIVRSAIQEKEEYIVQIYSSPSKDDADEWARKLKRKNAKDVVISPHKVRDVIWYRVRFGKFTSKDEARSVALRYGFAQTWIDRVK